MCSFEHPTLLDYFILVYLFIGGWWREDFAWWRDRSLVASSLLASLPGGEVTSNQVHISVLFVTINFLFIFDVCSFSEQERSQQAHLYMTDPFLCRGRFLLMDLLNFLHPEISMYILYTVFFTFPKVLTRRFCSTIKSSCTC